MLTVVCLAAPQCIAYAIIAGIPPVVGLYAATIPTMVAALPRFRTTGQPNQCHQLIVFTEANGIAKRVSNGCGIHLGSNGWCNATHLYLCRLENLISFVSQPVVVGYITGVAVLIGISQLPNISRTTAVGDTILQQVYSWSIISATPMVLQ